MLASVTPFSKHTEIRSDHVCDVFHFLTALWVSLKKKNSETFQNSFWLCVEEDFLSFPRADYSPVLLKNEILCSLLFCLFLSPDPDIILQGDFVLFCFSSVFICQNRVANGHPAAVVIACSYLRNRS